ncbi:MAG TPA: hypothetical protein VGJ20_17550 [Xanthobacteraceae bacterium]|jgi:hypothetical protein
MAGQDRAGDQDLTGIWNGLYTYQDGRSTTFVATLIDGGGSLSGTTHEPSATGDGPSAMLYANLVGSHRDHAVTFTKTYERPDRQHRSPILYEGTLSGDGSEIEGRWTITRVWSGKFMMIRATGSTAERARKAFQRA